MLTVFILSNLPPTKKYAKAILFCSHCAAASNRKKYSILKEPAWEGRMLMYRQAATTAAEQELTQAVRRVIDRYGRDLTSYFNHVQEVAEQNAQEQRTEEAHDNEPTA
jgi:hypothetical protein